MNKNRELFEAVKLCIEHRERKNFKGVSPGNDFLNKLENTFPCSYHSPYPYFISWSITCECNLRCKHCYYFYNQDFFQNKQQDLSLNECFSFIDQAADFKILQLTLSGGEPFCRKDIFKILKYIKQKRIPLHIQTNGTLLNKFKIAKLSKILNNKVDTIQISLDGATKEINDKTRGKGAFAKAIKNIELLQENNFNVDLNFTITNQNQHELLDFYKLACQLGVLRVSFGRIHPSTKNHEYLLPDEKKLAIDFAKLIRYSEKNNGKTTLFTNLYGKIFNLLNIGLNSEDENVLFEKYRGNSLKELCCLKYPNAMVVETSGEVFTCGKRSGVVLGNLRQKSLSEIWENRFDNDIVKGRKTKNLICKKCDYLDKCKGGCPSVSLSINGDINTPDPRCMHAKKLLEKSR